MKPYEAPGAASFWRWDVAAPFVLVALIWGSTWLVIRDQLGVVPPSWSVAYRFALAAAAMFVLARVRGDSLRIGRGGLVIAAALGAMQFMLNFQFVYRAELHLTSGVVAVLFALLIAPNAVLARILLRQRIPPLFLAGTAVAFAGVAMLLIHEFRTAPPQGRVGLGIVLAGLGVLSASGGNVIQALDRARALPMITLLAWAMLLGAVANVAAAWALEGPPVWDPRWRYAAGVAYLAIVGSVITFPLYFSIVRKLGPGRAAYNAILVPMVAMGLSTLFEGYRWTPLAAGGAGLALAGLLLALRARSPSR